MVIIHQTKLRVFAIHDEKAFVFNKEDLIYAKAGDSIGHYFDDKGTAQKVIKDSHYHIILSKAVWNDPKNISTPIE